jgi:hypothetical protein
MGDIVLSWPVAVVLAASAFRHLANPYYFLGCVYSYDLVGPRTGEAIALVVPFLMLTLAVCVVGDLWKDAALLVTLIVLGTFAVAQWTAWTRGRTIECGCFGPSYGEEVIGVSSLGTVFALLFLTAASLALRRHSPVSRHETGTP